MFKHFIVAKLPPLPPNSPSAELILFLWMNKIMYGLAFVLVLNNDRTRFRRSRDVGCYIGLRPKQRDSGQRAPQLGITKAGDPLLRRLATQCAQHVLGPFGKDSALRRWGMSLALRGGKNAKKRAVIAVARKLVILMHRIWITQEIYEPLRGVAEKSTAA